MALQTSHDLEHGSPHQPYPGCEDSLHAVPAHLHLFTETLHRGPCSQIHMVIVPSTMPDHCLPLPNNIYTRLWQGTYELQS